MKGLNPPIANPFTEKKGTRKAGKKCKKKIRGTEETPKSTKKS